MSYKRSKVNSRKILTLTELGDYFERDRSTIKRHMERLGFNESNLYDPISFISLILCLQFTIRKNQLPYEVEAALGRLKVAP